MFLAGILILTLLANCGALRLGRQVNDLVQTDVEPLSLEEIITYARTQPTLNWEDSIAKTIKVYGQKPNYIPVTSSATSGQEFQMKKTRDYTGSWPEWSDVPQDALIRTGNLTRCESERWAVVTTIFDPSEAVKYMEAFPGWCTVVVGDKKSPREYLSGSLTVIYLSAEIQEYVFRKTAVFNRLPWNSFGRKNLGYLFAMSQGARTIFDFDDDNVPQRNMPQPIAFARQGEMNLRLLGGCSFANVYPLFTSQGLPWPRGLPLSGIHKNDTTCHTFKSAPAQEANIAVEQTLAQSNPDVDAIYRLTQKLPLEFRQQEDPVVLEPGTFAPFNAQSTLWHRPAFLAMLLPISVNGRVSDILRSYIAQPILWAGGLKVAFSTPQVKVAERNPHNLKADFEGEWPLYYKTEKLLEGLRKMEMNKSLAEQLFAIYVYLYEHEIIEESDMQVAKAWIEDVQAFQNYDGSRLVPKTRLAQVTSMEGGGKDALLSQVSTDAQALLLVTECYGDREINFPGPWEWKASLHKEFAANGWHVDVVCYKGYPGKAEQQLYGDMHHFLDVRTDKHPRNYSSIHIPLWDAGKEDVSQAVQIGRRISNAPLIGFFEGYSGQRPNEYVEKFDQVAFLSKQPCLRFQAHYPKVKKLNVLREGWAFDHCFAHTKEPLPESVRQPTRVCFMGNIRKAEYANLLCQIAQSLPLFNFTSMTQAGMLRHDSNDFKCRAENMHWITQDMKKDNGAAWTEGQIEKCNIMLDFAWDPGYYLTRPTTKALHAVSCAQPVIIEQPSDFESYAGRYGAVVPFNASASSWASAIQSVSATLDHASIRKDFPAERSSWTAVMTRYAALIGASDPGNACEQFG